MILERKLLGDLSTTPAAVLALRAMKNYRNTWYHRTRTRSTCTGKKVLVKNMLLHVQYSYNTIRILRIYEYVRRCFVPPYLVFTDRTKYLIRVRE